MIAFLNKNQIINRSKELAVLYSLGYQKKHIFSIIFFENLIVFSLSFIVAIVFALLINILYLSKTRYYSYFSNLATASNIWLLLLFIFVMMLISDFWSVNTVQQKQIRKYLNH
ncbi:FtsX-like permease family protein [Tuanshanicoccus lijuaniae]|uniref:FtsX-like permease family protein n=1 Tax=Aerococcaceae bacterium zg-1292 TaxID=2774330 RepID=UPI001BD9018E|nr:FtsX-like permease family protein [Aerococcaceae bacterium zg-A91]MBS4458344.1 FtsX-like permease family protein [Aerococcaceae bacterium zg-BR33]